MCPEFTVLNMYFLLFRIFQQLALALKNRVALIFFTVLNMYFLSFRIFEQLALALKNRVALELFTCIEIIFIIQDFWATCACPENIVWPENFHCIGYTFYIQEFWAICACPEKQRVPWISCNKYVFFIIHDVRVTCPEKQSCPGIFYLYWNILYHSGF